MSELQQLVYISKATFATGRQELGVEPEVGRILVQSRRNNPRRGLVGALYYGDGNFFQCLEGTPQALDSLYQTLLADPRHKDLKVLYRKSIDGTSFKAWAMKYVPVASDVRALMKQHGLKRFDPYNFSPDTVLEMVDLLHRGADGGPATPAPGAHANAKRGPLTMMALLALAALAVVIAVIIWLH